MGPFWIFVIVLYYFALLITSNVYQWIRIIISWIGFVLFWVFLMNSHNDDFILGWFLGWSIYVVITWIIRFNEPTHPDVKKYMNDY